MVGVTLLATFWMTGTAVLPIALPVSTARVNPTPIWNPSGASLSHTSGVLLPRWQYRSTGQYLIGNSRSTIQVEAFVDLFCDDAAAEFAMWKKLKVSGALSPADVALQVHVLVEPFHPWSFTASVGAQTVAQYGPEAFFSFAESCWAHHTDFVADWGDQRYTLSNLTEAGVVAELASFARTAGVPDAAFMAGMTNRSTAGGTNPWAVAREAWKFAVARGVASSPWYFVNGVPYFAASDAAHAGAESWLGLIRRLIAKQ
eukprot:1806538-Prymnesium_polylepis.1